MGATTFLCNAKGKSMQEAFIAARRESAKFGGYSGTIAEKNSYEVVSLPKAIVIDKKALYAKIEELSINKFDDKWGPAGCVQIDSGEYLFFGTAST